MKRSLGRIAQCFVLLLAMGSVAHATNGVVSTCSYAGFTTVFNTVNGSGGGTITFNCSGTTTLTVNTTYLQVSSAIVIDGNNKIIFDGNNAFPFFQVSNGASLTLKRLTFQRGVFNSVHALENFGTLNLDTVTVKNNVSDLAPVANYATMAVASSTFSNNTANSGTTGGGAINNDGSLLRITSTTFTQNTSHSGGAIQTTSGTLIVDRSQFMNNESNTTGGAVSCSGDTVAIVNSAFGNNNASSYGGGVYSECAMTITNSTFNINGANGGGGGAIYQTGSQPGTISFATIVGNSAIFGAGIYNDDMSGSSLTISKSIISNNSDGNCDGVLLSGGYNLANDMGCNGLFGATDKSGANLPLGAFGNNGGPTSTMLPQAGNQAINFVAAGECGVSRDQRIADRPFDSKCDSGAVEVSGAFDGIFADGLEY